MAKNILLTILKGSATCNFPKLNELRLTFKKTQLSGLTKIKLYVNAATTFTIIGNGNFTTSTASVLGKTQVAGKEGEIILYVQDTVNTISVSNKHNITRFAITDINGLNSTPIALDNNIADFKHLQNLGFLDITNQQVTGNISAINTLPWLTVFWAANNKLTGDIAEIKNLTNVTSLNLNFISGIYGDIVNLKNFTKLSFLSLKNTPLYGDISNLSNLTNLTELYIQDTGISGDIAVFSGLTKLTRVDFQGLSNLTGDLATLNNNIRYITGNETNVIQKFKWTLKLTNNRTDILFCYGITIESGADQFLIDMASCNFNPLSPSATNIRIKAKLTSASNAAIETLRSKGVTVTILSL